MYETATEIRLESEEMVDLVLEFTEWCENLYTTRATIQADTRIADLWNKFGPKKEQFVENYVHASNGYLMPEAARAAADLWWRKCWAQGVANALSKAVPSIMNRKAGTRALAWALSGICPDEDTADPKVLMRSLGLQAPDFVLNWKRCHG